MTLGLTLTLVLETPASRVPPLNKKKHKNNSLCVGYGINLRQKEPRIKLKFPRLSQHFLLFSITCAVMSK